MGVQINTQPQTLKSASTVVGATAGLSAVNGLTVYGDISASGTIYGTSANVMLQNVITATGASAYTLTNYTNNTASNYLVFLDGVKQRATTDYTISGSTITFTSPVPSGVVIEVNVPQNISSLAGGTVTSVGLSSDGSLSIVTGSPVTTTGNIALKVGTVPLGSISTSGATAGQVLTYNGSTSTWVASAAPGNGGGSLVRSTAVTTNGQTSVDFTGIPSTAKRVTVMCYGVSTTTSTPVILLQLGTAGGIQTTGYLGSTDKMESGVAPTTFTTGLALANSGDGSGAAIQHCVATFLNVTSNQWIGTVVGAWSNIGSIVVGGTSVTLGGTLDRVRLTTTNGTDTFDAGTVNIIWE